MFIVEKHSCNISIASNLPIHSSTTSTSTSSLSISTQSLSDNSIELTKSPNNNNINAYKLNFNYGFLTNMLCTNYINTKRISDIHSTRRFSFKTEDTLNNVSKVVRKLSAPTESISFSTLSVGEKNNETSVYNNNSEIILMNEKNNKTTECLNKNIQVKNDCSICSTCSSCLISSNHSQHLTVAKASRFDQSIMLLSALTRTRESTSQWAKTNPACNFPHKYLRKTSLTKKKNKHSKCSQYIDDDLKNNTKRNLEHQQQGQFNCIEKNKIKHYNSKKKNKTLKSFSNNYLDHYSLKTEGIIIKNNNNYSTNIKKKCDEMQSACLIDCISPAICKQLFEISEDMNLLVRNITKEAKALVNAEICSLFLLDKENGELVAEVFEKNGTSDEYLTEIRMPIAQGIVGHVALTGRMMNIKNVYRHPYFYSKVDERTGFITRNILCFPIKDSQGHLVGVAELCNKIGKSQFTKNDEQIAATFSVYCAISISHCLLYRKLQEAHRRSHMAAELLVQGSTISIAPEDILRLTVRDIPLPTSFHPEFTQFSFVPRSIGTGDIYVEASLSMFKELGFIDKYRVRRRTLARFLLMVQKGYREVPYHNWSHAFAVGHFCYLILRIPAVKQALNDLERFALLVACLCHDIDHRGTTNAFQLQSKTPLAQLYSSEGSVLERHHFAQTVSILGMDECNIFEQLTRQQYQQVLDAIREIILATDIAAHLRKVSQIKQMVEDGYNSDSPDHHYLLMCLIMTASDLSDQSKDFKNSKGIAESIYKEFFSQGDLEKQMGNRPIEMMDRERACVPKIQLEFMDTVALSIFDYLSQLLPDLNSTYESLLRNRQCWLILDQILQEEGLPSGGLDYLRDIELEKRVISRVNQQNSVATNTALTSDEKKKQKNIEEKTKDITNNSTTNLSTQLILDSSIAPLSATSTFKQSTSGEGDVNVSEINYSASPSPTSISKIKINN